MAVNNILNPTELTVDDKFDASNFSKLKLTDEQIALFSKMVEILTTPDTYKGGLDKLNTELTKRLSTAPPSNLGPSGYDYAEFDILNLILQEKESEFGLNVDGVAFTQAFLETPQFYDIASEHYLIQDTGVPARHGDFTHRIQMYIVFLNLDPTIYTKDSFPPLFQSMSANASAVNKSLFPVGSEEENGEDIFFVWDAIFDRLFRLSYFPDPDDTSLPNPTGMPDEKSLATAPEWLMTKLLGDWKNTYTVLSSLLQDRYTKVFEGRKDNVDWIADYKSTHPQFEDKTIDHAPQTTALLDSKGNEVDISGVGQAVITLFPVK